MTTVIGRSKRGRLAWKRFLEHSSPWQIEEKKAA
jgi:hypothetical protein